MRNRITVLLQVLLVGCLAFSLIGCRKKTTETDGMPYENVGEIEISEDFIISNDAWIEPAEMGGETASIYKTVYFELDKSTIRAEFQPVLEAIADDLKANPKRFVRATGHCCDLGTNEYNFSLGERRAESVRVYLVALGIDAGRVRTLSKGEEEPAAPNTDAQRELNRRVEFGLYDRE
ncbi:MAG: OmpA family protein [Verrucomicrobia bacterium]|nr:OmpA family protein [Verrucomicrobiota bacterium]